MAKSTSPTNTDYPPLELQTLTTPILASYNQPTPTKFQIKHTYYPLKPQQTIFFLPTFKKWIIWMAYYRVQEFFIIVAYDVYITNSYQLLLLFSLFRYIFIIYKSLLHFELEHISLYNHNKNLSCHHSYLHLIGNLLISLYLLSILVTINL